ncbi:MAG TPA: radical SAM protein, partial [Acidimicrobiales bacterium]|nr:radical SAM protein [Acidimicrobiales bacterium]
MRPPPSVDFAKAPFLVIWETTQACGLACTHCRASAQPLRHPEELSTAEGERLLEEVAGMGTPVCVLSGGDPVERPDIYTLVRKGASLGLRMGTIPAATDRLTEDVVRRLRDAGLEQMALSLDFPRADLHDAFRGVPGAFAKTMAAVEWAHAHGLPLQINTTVCGRSAPYLGEMAAMVERLGIVFWEVFFLVPVGRGAMLGGLASGQCEDLFAILYRTQKQARFVVKVTEAPHYRRYVAQHEAA